MNRPIFHSLLDTQVAALLQEGNIGIVPTDTIYGVVCAASDQSAVQRLYSVKKRDKKPGTITAASIDQLVKLGFKARYLKAVEGFWPNAITIEIPTGFDLSYLHMGMGRIAVRIPKHELFTKLLEKTGPLLTSSANQPGEPPANVLQEAIDYFNDEVDFYVDGGDLSSQKPSTIIRILDDAVEVIREGAVTIDEKTGRILS